MPAPRTGGGSAAMAVGVADSDAASGTPEAGAQHAGVHAHAAASIGSPLSLKGAIVRPVITPTEASKTLDAAAELCESAAGDSSGPVPTQAGAPAPTAPTCSLSWGRLCEEADNTRGPEAVREADCMHDEPASRRREGALHTGQESTRGGHGGYDMGTQAYSSQQGEPPAHRSTRSAGSVSALGPAPQGDPEEDSVSEDEFDGVSMRAGVPRATAGAPIISPANDHGSQHRAEGARSVEGILQDLEEAIESVAIDTSTVQPPSLSPYVADADVRHMHAPVSSRPLQPFPPDALDGSRASGHFHVHSSASRSPSGRLASDGDAGEAHGQAGNKYLARLKLPTAQPSVASRSWLKGGAHAPTSASVAGGMAGWADGRRSGPSGFDPVAGLLGFSTGPRSGSSQGVAGGQSLPDVGGSQSAWFGGGWGGALPSCGGVREQVCAPLERQDAARSHAGVPSVTMCCTTPAAHPAVLLLA